MLKMKIMMWLPVMFAGLAAVAAADITGRVTDADTGGGLAGVIVSNCAEAAVTDAAGAYVLPRHADTRFVTVVTPADRSAETFFQRVTVDSDTSYDFKLQRRPKFDSFCFVQMSDTEAEGSPVVMDCFDRIRRFARNCGAAFVIHTGDIHTTEDMRMHAASVNRRGFGLPVYHVLGNHDLKSEGRGEAFYEDTLGPIYYAFEEGNVLFVILPKYLDGDMAPGFTETDVAKYLHNLMALVPETRPVVFVSHYPEILAADGVAGAGTPYPTDLKKWNLKGWIYGHTHYSRVASLPFGLKTWSSCISTKGGGSGEAASYRYYHVAADGTLSSRVVPMFVEKLLDVRISPAADGGGYTVAAAAGDSSTLITGLEMIATGTDGESERLAMTRRGPWLWTAVYPFEPERSYTVEVVATLNSGETIRKTVPFPAPISRTASLELERIAWFPGHVHWGAPAFGDGMIFAGINDDDDGTNSGIAALDAATGRLRWKLPVAAGIRNSVCYDAGTVYAADTDSNLYAVEAETGILRWKSSPGPVLFDHKNSNGIVLADGILYGGFGRYLRAVEAATGRELWRSALSQWDPSTDPPQVIDGKLIISNSGHGWILAALDAATGSLVWKLELDRYHFQVRTSRLADGNLLMVSSARSAIVEPETGRMIAATSEELGGDELLSMSASAPLVGDGLIYVGVDWEGVGAFDFQSLRRRWTSVETAGVPGVSRLATQVYSRLEKIVESAPLLLGSRLLFAGMDGVLYECSAADGVLEGRLDLGVPVSASPLVAAGRVYLVDYAGRVFIFKLRGDLTAAGDFRLK